MKYSQMLSSKAERKRQWGYYIDMKINNQIEGTFERFISVYFSCEIIRKAADLMSRDLR